MNILQLLSGTGFIVINKSIAERHGLYSAIMLGELSSKYLYYRDNGQLTEDGFFFVTIEDMERSTTLSRHKQDEGLKALQDIGFIETDVRGLPGKRHFRIAEDVIISQFVKNSQTTLPFDSEPLCKKLTTNNKNIYIENKENILLNKGVTENEDKPVEVLFPAFDTSKETPFRDSIAYEEVVFKAALKKEAAMGVDIFYYYHSVSDWCDGLRERDKRKKRTARGWVATARKFMRDDNSKRKLKLVGTKRELEEAEELQFLSL